MFFLQATIKFAQHLSIKHKEYLFNMIKHNHTVIKAQMNIRKVSVIYWGIRKWKFLLFYIAHCIIREIPYPTTCKEKTTQSKSKFLFHLKTVEASKKSPLNDQKSLCISYKKETKNKQVSLISKCGCLYTTNTTATVSVVYYNQNRKSNKERVNKVQYALFTLYMESTLRNQSGDADDFWLTDNIKYFFM